MAPWLTRFRRAFSALQVKTPVQLSYEILTPKTVTPQVIAKSPHAPIIFIHGLFGSKQNFRSVGKGLSRALATLTISVDLRNHGGSPHAQPFSYEAMARDVIELLENTLSGNPYTLIGHSMGAKVAMMVSLLAPQLVDKLVVVDNAPVAAGLGLAFDQDLQAMQAVERAQLPASSPTWKQDAEAIIAKYEPNPNVRVFLMANLTNKPLELASPVPFDDGFVHVRLPVNHFGAGTKNPKSLLTEVGGWPAQLCEQRQFVGGTLVMKASKSAFINPGTMANFERYFPKFTYHEFDTGHWLITERPTEFMELVVEFVKG